MARVLVVDDEEADRVGLASILEKGGHEVHSASSAGDALVLYLKQRFHVVVTDIVMHDEDGLDLISALMGFDADASVIAVSGKSLPRLRVSETIGARRIFTKPVQPEALLAAVTELVGEEGP